MSVRGNTIGTTTPRPDYAEQDEKQSSFIRNKPTQAIALALQTAEAALARTGGAMSGPLSVLEPTEAGHAASRGYVDGKHRNITVQLPAKEWSTSVITKLKSAENSIDVFVSVEAVVVPAEVGMMAAQVVAVDIPLPRMMWRWWLDKATKS